MKEDDERQAGLPYASPYHAPVLCKAVLDGLIHKADGVYLDGTLGGGGHSAAILDALDPAGRVIGIDRDPDALEAAVKRIDSPRFQALAGTFGEMRTLLESAGIFSVDGILLDLGVSSHQIDEAKRGFSYMQEGPLDMRMDKSSEVDAAQIVNTWSVEAIARILRSYGEEPRAYRIAQSLVAARPVESTRALADVVRKSVREKEQIKTLSRVFQALRIAVNNEIEELERALSEGLAILNTGGRMAVISYHSLEDRPVKRFLRYGNFSGTPERDFYGNLLTPWRLVTRKPIEADPSEVTANPRARSARLRIAEKL